MPLSAAPPATMWMTTPPPLTRQVCSPLGTTPI
jgi:hypothetical protein